MAEIIKFESPTTKRIVEINKEMETIGDAALAKVFQEQMKIENGVDVPDIVHSNTIDDYLLSIGEMLKLKREKENLLGQ